MTRAGGECPSIVFQTSAIFDSEGQRVDLKCIIQKIARKRDIWRHSRQTRKPVSGAYFEPTIVLSSGIAGFVLAAERVLHRARGVVCNFAWASKRTCHIPDLS